MSPDETVRDHFRHQAESCQRLGSPFTARLCRLLADTLDPSTQIGGHVLHWPGNTREDALALRLCGGLHALVLTGADAGLAAAYPPNAVDDRKLGEAFSGALERHAVALGNALASAPQTNEIARSAMLLPGFLTIARATGLPLAIREIGSSAGLNLLFDRFCYRYGDNQWGRKDSPVRLMPELRGKEPPLGGFLEVASRKGADIAPVNIADEESRLRLKSYIWPDQTARLERLDAALRIAADHPLTVDRIDAADFVERELASREEGQAFVLFHSIMWQYMPDQTRRRIETLLDTAAGPGPAAPIAWLRMEPVATTDPFATLRLTLWPGGVTRDFARCDYHGRWIEWLDG